jgi:hypothetical protein
VLSVALPCTALQGRADLLKQTCGRYLRVWEIQAGHCPHDEQPAAVNTALLEFVEQMVLPQGQQQQQQQQQQEVASTSTAVAATARATS